MRYAPIIAFGLMAVLTSTGWGSDIPRQAMEDGVRLYKAKSFDAAAAAFERAAESAPQNKLDASVAKYNAANALFRIGQFGAAATNFAEATHSPDLALQSKAYYNRGNALVTASETQEKQGGLDTAVGSIDEALAMYENAITLAPGDEDAKINYELALKRKQELQQKQQQQQQNQDKKDQQKEDQSQKQDEQKKGNQDQQQKNEQRQQQQDQQKDKAQQQQQQQTADQQKQQAQPQKSEDMTPEEARMMLDAMKQEEQANREKMRLVVGEPSPVDKDW